LSLEDIGNLGSFSPVLKAFWAGQPETWLPAMSVSLPIQLSVTRLRFSKGINPGLLHWAIRTRIGLRLLPLLVNPTLLLFGKVTTLRGRLHSRFWLAFLRPRWLRCPTAPFAFLARSRA
jgi:hypothetical protein